MDALQYFYNYKLIKSDDDTNSVIYTAKNNNSDAIIIIKNKEIIDNISNIKNLQLMLKNDRFYKYSGTTNTCIEIIVICPALDEDYAKYCYNTKILLETPNIYKNEIYPKIIQQDLTWIDNIISGISEQDKIVYQDDDIIMLPDLKWTSNNIEEMYYLIIFKNKQLKSIRDLNKTHLPLLDKAKKISCDLINKLHNIDNNQLRLYFHYRPTFWQLHLHINLINKVWKNSSIDNAYQLSKIITNIKLFDNYYQKIDIEVCVRN
jgi:m7GpppX diphosphatase